MLSSLFNEISPSSLMALFRNSRSICLTLKIVNNIRNTLFFTDEIIKLRIRTYDNGVIFFSLLQDFL